MIVTSVGSGEPQRNSDEHPGDSHALRAPRTSAQLAKELVHKKRAPYESASDRLFEESVARAVTLADGTLINSAHSMKALERQIASRVVGNREVVGAVAQAVYHHLKRHGRILEVPVVAQVFERYLNFEGTSRGDKRAFIQKASRALRTQLLDRRPSNPICEVLRVLIKYGVEEKLCKRRYLERPEKARPSSREKGSKSLVKVKKSPSDSQDPASKRALSRKRVPGYNELAGIMQKSLYEVQMHSVAELGPHRNVLILGDSGSGKTLITRAAAAVAGVPFLDVNCSNLSESGYVGDNASDIMTLLLEAAGGNKALAMTGIVHLDEIDKIAGDRRAADRDVSGAGAQRNLLKLVEGMVDPQTKLNSQGVLFICSGSFEGLHHDIARRLGHGLGFGITRHENEAVERAGLLKKAIKPDLENFGMFRELLGRIGRIVATDAMTEERMLEILDLPLFSPIVTEKRLLAGDGIDVRVPPEVKRMIVRAAAFVDVGARGLDTTVAEVFHHIERQASELSPRNRARVKVEPGYVMKYFVDSGKFTSAQLRRIAEVGSVDLSPDTPPELT